MRVHNSIAQWQRLSVLLQRIILASLFGFPLFVNSAWAVSIAEITASHAYASRAPETALDRVSLQTAEDSQRLDGLWTAAEFADTGSNEQGRRLSGVLPMAGWVINGDTYTANAFNAFKYETNRVRSAVLAGADTVAPILAAKSQVAVTPETQALLGNRDLYQEMLIHAVLSGARQFVYQNADASAADDVLLDSVLAETDAQLGDGALLPTVDNLADWHQPYLLTAAVGTNGAVWRFTPQLDTNSTLASTVQQQQPAILKAGDVQLTLPRAQVVSIPDSVAAQGIWLKGFDNSASAACAERLVVGRECVAFYEGDTAGNQAALLLEQPARLPSQTLGQVDTLFERDWKTGGADAGVGQDHFTVQYHANLNFAEGVHQFAVKADDAVRLWVDGQLLIDGKTAQATAVRILTAEAPLAAGQHTLKLEYTDIANEAAVGLYVQRATDKFPTNSGCKSIPENAYCAEYFNNNALADNPVKIQNEDAINYEWKDGSPAEGVNKDNFSVRWQGDFDFTAGSYRFITRVDDRMRLWVDDKLTIDQWDSYDYYEHFQDVDLSAGKHRIRVEMREFGGWARAMVSWEANHACSGVPDNAFCGFYYDGIALEGDVKRTRLDSKLDFEWGTGRPMQGVKPDQFSARWLGNFDFPESGYYRFSGVMDDGVRVWVDDTLVVDQWGSYWGWPGQFQSAPYIEAGKHQVRVEFMERYGAATVKLNWALVEGCGAVPENALCMLMFNNETLSGIPQQVLKTPAAIDYDWGSNAPDPLVLKDRFSVRWFGKVHFDEGLYRFVSNIDDGVRIWVDGELLLDAWNRVWPYYGNYRKLRRMTGGLHDVRVEYREAWGAAVAKVFWEKAPDCSGDIPEGKFCATFYEFSDMTQPVDTRLDDAIDFNWGGDAALPGYIKDNFAISWVGDAEFEDGRYTFSTTTDDGVRLWLDEQPLIDKWRNQSATTYNETALLKAGKHRVRMDYYERGGAAVAKLGWEKNTGCTTIPSGAFCAEYFNNNNLTGNPAVIRNDAEINFEWKDGVPVAGVEANNFSVRWQGDFELAGDYRLVAQVDDRMRVWVDGKLMFDLWDANDYKEHTQDISLSAGTHRIQVEMREFGGWARAKLFWEQKFDCSQIPTGEFCGTYFNGTALEGEPLRTEMVDAVNFDWGGNSPMHGVGANQFSARWVGNFALDEGEYTFTVRSDDGFRLWVDGTALVDAWKPQAPTTYTKRVFLPGGTHTIKAEYYEAWGGAVAQFGWKADQLGQPQTPANLRTSALSQTSVGLQWDAQPLVAGYRVYRDGTLLGEVKEAAFTDKTVTVTQTYAYTVTALWPNGHESAPASLRVTVADTEAPTAPASLRVESLTSNSVNLIWQAASDNVAVIGYQVWRDGVLAGQSAIPSFIDTGLESYSRHTYAVVALDAAGNASARSTGLTTYTADASAPTVPQSVQAVAAQGQVQLSWQPSSDNLAVSYYRIVRDGVEIGQSSLTRYADNTVQQNVAYQYRVIAVDAAGNVSEASAVASITSGDTTAPDAPTGLVAVADAALMRVNLSWNAAADNVGVTQYRVLRDGRLLATTKQTGYTDSDVVAGNTYTYTVRALDVAGNVSLVSHEAATSLLTICASTLDYYTQHVETQVNNCVSCHMAGGMAQNTRFILSKGDNSTERNLLAVQSITQTLGKTTVLEKASGQIAHGGGAVLPLGSDALQMFTSLLEQLETPQDCSTTDAGNDVPVMTESLAANCANCHGTNGVSAGPATPSIAGMDSSYLAGLMRNYQTGDRASTVMQRIAKGYSADDIKRLAGFFAEQPFAVAEQVTDPGAVARGSDLHGQYCAACHMSGGRDDRFTGVRLAGQWKPYLQQTLHDFATKASHAPITMADQMAKMLEEKGEGSLSDLAEFYASAGNDTQAPPAPEFVEVAAYTATGITLTWMDASDDWGIAYYEIYRDGTLIGSTRFNAFTDTGLVAGSYHYTVVAVDVSGNRSVVSEEVSATLAAQSTAPEGVQLLDYPATLRKASILLLNRVPTVEEMAAAQTGEDFRATLRAMLDEQGALDQFVYRAGHEVFLSNGAARATSGSGIQVADFPNLETLTDAEMNIVKDTIRKEPVFLMEYIVAQDHPWTEVLTADYTVLNPPLAKALGAETLENFANADDATELRPARVPRLSARLGDQAFPHAGVLTTNAWLSRFPSTDTNRNRHRASNVYKQFLGLNIEALAQRPLNDSNNGNFLVPTMENPNCMVCHTIMDPVAGTFKNWGNNARFFQNFNGEKGSLDSIAGSYKSSSYPLNHLGQRWYHTGDTWYRDMLMPGFADKLMPGGYESTGGETWTETDNLLKNPSAELGLDGWMAKTGTAEASNVDACSRIPRAPQSGKSLFQMGVCEQATTETLLQQDVAVGNYASDIDVGKVTVNYGAYLTTKGYDIPSVWITFMDANGQELGSSGALLTTVSWRWDNKTASQLVPVGTRSLRFNMRGVRSAYSWADPYIDAYVDDVFMTLKTPASKVAGDAGIQDGLQWLGKQLVQDSRFAKGGVQFWYRTLFKRAPLSAPVNPADPDYTAKLAAYNAQDALLEALAKQFSQDQGHGAWNVKDLLVEMTASPLFRAASGYLTDEQQQAAPDMGLARLLTPEEVDGKLKSLLGVEWNPFKPGAAWSNRMGLFYGGFDGGNVQLTPNTDMNTLMSRIPERMAIELSCNATYQDFRLGATQRKLFPLVDAADTPTLEELAGGEANMLLNPGAEQGMSGWTIAEGTARILSGARGCAGGPSIYAGQATFNPGSICSGQSPDGVLYQDVDVTAWAAQIDAGKARALYGAALTAWSTNNDEAGVYLGFRDASGAETGTAPVLSTTRGVWEVRSSDIILPAGTRVIRFYMKGHNLGVNSNTDAFVDNTYLRVVSADSDYMSAGEKRIRSNIQFLHRYLLNEELALDDPEVTRTYRLFTEVQANGDGVGSSVCRLYNNNEDPQRTKRAWSIVLMYLLTDARFLYE